MWCLLVWSFFIVTICTVFVLHSDFNPFFFPLLMNNPLGMNSGLQ